MRGEGGRRNSNGNKQRGDGGKGGDEGAKGDSGWPPPRRDRPPRSKGEGAKSTRHYRSLEGGGVERELDELMKKTGVRRRVI